MAKKREAPGFSGLDMQGLDVDVRQTLMQDAVRNKAALTAKQRWDRKRVRRTFDLNPTVIAALRAVAEKEGVSMSKLANFLLARVLLTYFEDPAMARALDLHKRPVYTSQFDWVPDPPEDWLARLQAQIETMQRRKGWGVK